MTSWRSASRSRLTRLLAEAQPHAQRALQAHERDAVFAQDRIEPRGARSQCVGERSKRGARHRRQRRGSQGGLGGGGVDRGADVAPGTNAHRHRDDRVRVEIVGARHRAMYSRSPNPLLRRRAAGAPRRSRRPAIVTGEGGRPSPRRTQGQRAVAENAIRSPSTSTTASSRSPTVGATPRAFRTRPNGSGSNASARFARSCSARRTAF